MSKNIRIIWIIIIAAVVLAFCVVFMVWAAVEETNLYALDAQSGKVQWAVPIQEIGVSDPAVDDHRVFVDIHTRDEEGQDDVVFAAWDLVAYDAETGQELWRVVNSPVSLVEAVEYPPVATANIVIDDIADNEVGIYDVATGKLLDQIEFVVTRGLITDDILPVAITEDWIILRHKFAIRGRKLAADSVWGYNRDIGKLSWFAEHDRYPTEETREAANFTPIIVGDHRVYLDVVGQFQAFDIDSGDFLFALDQTCKRAEIQGSTLYCVYGDLKAFDAATGERLWSFYPDDLDINLQEVEAVEDTLYVTTTLAKRRPYEQWLIALNPADGSERWRVQTWDGTGNSLDLWHVSPLVGKETVFALQIMRDQKALVALSAADGTQLWQRSLYGDYPRKPVSDGDQVYIIDSPTHWQSWLALR